MSSIKEFGKKLKLIAIKNKRAPRWADLKKFGLKRARSKMIRSHTKNWRRNKNKI